MNITRRSFLSSVSVGVAGAWLATPWAQAQQAAQKLRIAACDWSLGAGGPEGLSVAKACGLEGIEVSAGKPEDTLQIADAAYRAKYKEAMKATGIVAPSVAMGLLNDAPLASDPRGPAWLEQTIEATRDLGAKVILLAFFGRGDLRKDKELKAADIDVVVQRLKEAAPKAAQAGVILGVENTLSAEQNLAILDRVKSEAVQLYYDIGNSTDYGYDPPAEIRQLGARICQIHFKDRGSYLGEGAVKMEPVAEAIHAINYKGWIVLETACPSKDREADFKRNAEYARKLLGA